MPAFSAGAAPWTGSDAVITGMLPQSYDVSLTSYAEGWRASFLHRDAVYRSLDRAGSQRPFDTLGGGAARGLKGA